MSRVRIGTSLATRVGHYANIVGFTKIELLIGLALIGIVGVVAAPSWIRAQISANEAEAVGDTRDVISAEQAFASANCGYFDELPNLCRDGEDCNGISIPGYPDDGPEFLDGELGRSSPHRLSGYELSFEPGPAPASINPSCSTTSVLDDCYVSSPTNIGYTGARSFAGTGSGAIHSEPAGTPIPCPLPAVAAFLEGGGEYEPARAPMSSVQSSSPSAPARAPTVPLAGRQRLRTTHRRTQHGGLRSHRRQRVQKRSIESTFHVLDRCRYRLVQQCATLSRPRSPPSRMPCALKSSSTVFGTLSRAGSPAPVLGDGGARSLSVEARAPPRAYRPSWTHDSRRRPSAKPRLSTRRFRIDGPAQQTPASPGIDAPSDEAARRAGSCCDRRLRRAAGLVLPSTPGSEKLEIGSAIDRLRAGEGHQRL